MLAVHHLSYTLPLVGFKSFIGAMVNNSPPHPHFSLQPSPHPIAKQKAGSLEKCLGFFSLRGWMLLSLGSLTHYFLLQVSALLEDKAT